MSTLPPSLWAHTAEPANRLPSLRKDFQVDAAVVGGGYTGLRAALVMAEQGMSVVVLESEEPGWGASGRNGGAVNPMLPFNSPDEVGALVKPPFGDRLLQLSLDSADELFGIIDRYGIECDANRSGWIRTAHYPGAAETFTRQCEGWNAIGAGFELLDRGDLEHYLGTRAYGMGALIPRGGSIQPLSLAHGLARAAIAAGATVFGGSRVDGIARDGDQWTLSANGCRIRANSVIIGTNGYTGSLWPALAQSIVPTISVQVTTEPLPPALRDEILPQGHTFSDTRRMIIFGRKDRDHRFQLGSLGHTESFDDHPDFMRAKQEAIRLFPNLAGIEWAFQWGGRIAITRDHLPHLHEPASGIHIGLGYNGRGVAMSNIMGRVLAERAMGKPAADLDFPTTEIQPFPLHRFHRIGVRAVMSWMSIRDTLERMLGI